jgi:hypothetical protein
VRRHDARVFDVVNHEGELPVPRERGGHTHLECPLYALLRWTARKRLRVSLLLLLLLLRRRRRRLLHGRRRRHAHRRG